MTRNREKIFRFYFFNIAAISSKRESINVIKSSANAVLLELCWIATHTLDIKVRVMITLSNNTTIKKKMNVVDANRNIIKLTIQSGLDTTNYGNIDILLNCNFIREADPYMYDIL